MPQLETITAEPGQAAQFDVQYYLAERKARPDFTMVEIGHGGLPVAYGQDWEGERRYFGAEAWLRDVDHIRRFRLQELMAAHPNPNIQFLTLELDGEVQEGHAAEQDELKSWYVGDYDPTVPLPDGTADEVFLSNVVGDPHIADSEERTRSLLAEASRLTNETGVVVVRETISPHRARQSLTDEAIESANLQSVAHYPLDSKMWLRLEELYNAATTNWFPNSTNFYQFLAKTATS